MRLNVRDVIELQSQLDYPLVSIFVPLSAAAPRQAPIRTKNLVRETERRLNMELGSRETASLMAGLREQVAGIDFSLGGGSLALFASAAETRVLRLPYEVDEEVVIDDTFATRNLVHALQRMPRCLVVVIAPATLRLFDVTGDEVTEVTHDSYSLDPVQVVPEPSWDGAFARTADEFLGERMARDPLPLFLLAPDKTIGSFMKCSTLRGYLVGTVSGDFGGSSLERMRRVVMPLIREHLLDDRRRVLHRLIEARDAKRLASGINEVWDLAQQGRVSLVAVEQGFRYPATVGVNGELRAEEDRTLPGVVDDAVDEIVEAALRHDAEVRFADDGDLVEWGRIAAITRW